MKLAPPLATKYFQRVRNENEVLALESGNAFLVFALKLEYFRCQL